MGKRRDRTRCSSGGWVHGQWLKCVSTVSPKQDILSNAVRSKRLKINLNSVFYSIYFEEYLNGVALIWQACQRRSHGHSAISVPHLNNSRTRTIWAFQPAVVRMWRHANQRKQLWNKEGQLIQQGHHRRCGSRLTPPQQQQSHRGGAVRDTEWPVAAVWSQWSLCISHHAIVAACW